MHKSHLLLAAACSSLLAASASAAVLTLPLSVQEHDQWCWAGSSHSVLQYYGTSLPQCQIAEFARTHNTASDRNYGSTNCCTDWTQGCNDWNYMWGTGGSIDAIVASLGGVQTTSLGACLTQQDVWDEIDATHPFFIRWGWDAGGGHFIVGHGYDSTTLYYMNPWPGEGLKFADYSWAVRGETHTWTHSLTTSHATSGCAVSGCPAGQICDTSKDQCVASDCTHLGCPGGLVCDTSTGQCVQADCTVDGCPAGMACDASSGQCYDSDCYYTGCDTGWICDPATSKCVASGPCAGGEGSSCNDGDLCTSNDRCHNGQCAGTPLKCDASNTCQTSYGCNPHTGLCEYTDEPNGTVCDDGDPNTTSDECSKGVCAGLSGSCPALTVCHTTHTDGYGHCTLVPVADGTTCNDGDSATTHDVCTNGDCYGQLGSCPALTACHTTSTDSYGQCILVPVGDGTACNDGNPNTVNDACASGVCTGTTSNPNECAGRPEGSSCSIGSCRSGSCVSNNPHDPTPAPTCSTSGSRGDAMALALLAGIVLVRRRRQSQ